jgi:hypothetical protein
MLTSNSETQTEGVTVSGFENRTTRKIRAFANLQDGWRYDGIAFDPKILRIAEYLNLMALISGFPKTNAFPEKQGRVSVGIYDGSSYFEFTVLKSGRIDFLSEKDDEVEEELADLLISEAVQKIRQLRWNTSYTSTSVITTPTRVDSGVKPFRDPAIIAASRSSKGTVYSVALDAPVSMGIVTTAQILPVTRRYFGFSSQPFCSANAS